MSSGSDNDELTSITSAKNFGWSSPRRSCIFYESLYPASKLPKAFRVGRCSPVGLKLWRLSLRDKLPAYNTISDAVNLIRNSERIVILTGAGISEF